MMVKILPPKISIGCCGNEDNTESVRCIGLIDRIKSVYRDAEIEIISSPEGNEAICEFRSKRPNKELKLPIVSVDGKIVSVGRYPSADEISKWR